jgi:hypothetical protein
MDVYSTELGIRLSFGKTSEFRGGGGVEPPLLGTPLSRFQFCLFLPAIFLSLLIFFPVSLFVLSLHKKRRLQLKRSQGEGEVFPWGRIQVCTKYNFTCCFLWYKTVLSLRKQRNMGLLRGRTVPTLRLFLAITPPFLFWLQGCFDID